MSPMTPAELTAHREQRMLDALALVAAAKERLAEAEQYAREVEASWQQAVDSQVDAERIEAAGATNVDDFGNTYTA